MSATDQASSCPQSGLASSSQEVAPLPEEDVEVILARSRRLYETSQRELGHFSTPREHASLQKHHEAVAMKVRTTGRKRRSKIKRQQKRRKARAAAGADVGEAAGTDGDKAMARETDSDGGCDADIDSDDL